MSPVATRSGYGARSRDIARALINSDKYDVRIWSTPWGSTPMNALNPNNPKDKVIIDRLLPEPKLDKQPDVFIQITVPNEFQRLGQFNIGITAGIETTRCSGPWIEGCNRMDLVLTSSEHSKTTFMNSIYEKIDKNTQQRVGELKVEKPVQVLFEGVDLDIYNKTAAIDETIIITLSSVKEKFAFLFVGHWLNGDFGEDRKNVGAMIRTFLETFKNKQNTPALILKTSHANFSPLDRIDILRKIEIIKSNIVNATRLPSIYLIHGDLEDEEINSLYNHPKVKAHISFTKGEGFGRPLAEAALSGKPVIASDWSGHTDFLKHSVKLPGSLTQVHTSAAWENVIMRESEWFTVDYGYASKVMRDVFDNYKNYEIDAKKQATLIRKEFSLENMEKSLMMILEKEVPEAPTQLQLKLPQLKKLQLPSLKKIETNE
jgi:glycosyltransferase involved in cell wall biosynthesis